MTPRTDSHPNPYALTYEIDYPETLDRLTTFFRILWIIPIAIIYWLVSASSSATEVVTDGGEVVATITWSSGGIVTGLAAATGLMILFREKYPRWWFDFAAEFTRFGARVWAYFALQTDAYPSTDEEQTVHVGIDYPDVHTDLNRWMPLVKWLLAIPHYIVLFVLGIVAMFVLVVAWFAILFTGRYPKGLFDYITGLSRWALRVHAYVALLITDQYPPFSMR